MSEKDKLNILALLDAIAKITKYSSGYNRLQKEANDYFRLKPIRSFHGLHKR
jgi:hypothetical protein